MPPNPPPLSNVTEYSPEYLLQCKKTSFSIHFRGWCVALRVITNCERGVGGVLSYKVVVACDFVLSYQQNLSRLVLNHFFTDIRFSLASKY